MENILTKDPDAKRNCSTQSVSATNSEFPQIELLEIYIEKSRALGLGQRLLWHMAQFNKILTLPHIPDAKELYLQALSVKPKQALLNGQNFQFHEKLSQMLYTDSSNTVFYYNDYKVVLLLDFSQSTSSVYPGQTKSYVDKMRESLEVIIKNLLFQIQNKFKQKKNETAPLRKEPVQKRFSHKVKLDFLEGNSHDSQQSQSESDFFHQVHRDGFPAIEEQSESGANNAAPLFSQHIQDEKSDDANFFDDQKQDSKPKSTHHSNETRSAYFPKVYLSIVVSGLPPGNNIKLVVHNQKIDHRDLFSLLKTIDSRLVVIENQLRFNIQQKKTEDTIQGALQVHLENAQYILDLMSQDAKPLLVLFTDCTNSLLHLHDYKSRISSKDQNAFIEQFGQIDKSIHKLHLSDTRIISIDLQNENKTCNTLGYINHENELDYLTTITQGVHFTYKRLIEIDKKMQAIDRQSSPNSNLNSLQKSFGPQSSNYLFQSDGSVKFTESDDNTLIIQNKIKIKQTAEVPSVLPFEDIKAIKANNMMFGEKRCNKSLQVTKINTLQKIMFARPCNNRLFMESEEINNLIREPKVFDTLHVSHQQKYFIDLSLSQLLFNAKVVPLLQCEHLDEYYIEKVGFASLCEFRSKMGFKFVNVKFLQLNSQQNYSKKFIKENQLQNSNVLQQISYNYFIDSHIQIHCTLIADQYRSGITATYNLHAPASTLRNLYKAPDSLSMRDRLRNFVKSIQQKDEHFQLLEQIVRIIRKVQILFANPQSQKYRDPTRQRQKLYQGGLHNSWTQNQGQPKTSQETQDKRNLAHVPESKKKLHTVKIDSVFQSEEQARTYLLENKALWEQLTTMISFKSRIYQWKCYFRYSMITIITQAATVNASFELKRNPVTPEFWKRNIQEEWQIESQIEAALVEEIGNFTTFTLDNSNFVQVFEDSSNSSQYIQLNAKIRGVTRPKSKENLQRDDEGSQIFGRSDNNYGFCLIRLNWTATNIVECHFGFYQVGAKQRISFLKAFNKYINSKRQRGLKSSESKSNHYIEQVQEINGQFRCFEKNIASILMQTPKRYRFSLKYLNKQSDTDQDIAQKNSSEEFFQENDSEIANIQLDRLVFKNINNQGMLKIRRQSYLKSGIQSETSQLFHKQEWKWTSNNIKTNRELYYHILEQRISDGFLIVNRYQGTTEFFHMIKVLRATKDRQFLNNNRNRSWSFQSGEDVRSEVPAEPEKVEIVVQFLIYIEENDDQHNSVIREEIYMEQETSYFFLEKSNNSHSSSGSNDFHQNQQVVSGKDFFDQMVIYITEVDKCMHVQINTYHNIVKNSIHKQIQMAEVSLRLQDDKHGGQDAIKEAVCYFKNIQASTKRQRRNREAQICQKLQSLHREWKQFLKTRYPELFQNLENSISVEERKNEKNERVQKLGSSDIFNIEVQQLLDCGKIFGKQTVEVPELETFDNRLQRAMCENFTQNVIQTLKNFADWKISVAVCNDKESDVYFKLVTKEILMMIQVPCELQMLRQFDKNEGIQVVYMSFDKSMIRVTNENLVQSHIKKYFINSFFRKERVMPIQNFLFKKLGKTPQNLMKQVKSSGNFTHIFPNDQFGNMKNRINSRDFNTRKRTGSQAMINNDDSQTLFQRDRSNSRGNSFSQLGMPLDRTSIVSSGNDEEIHQIDQAEEVLLYYKNHRSRERMLTQLQFETKVKVILNNFQRYLAQSFEKVFAETVLLGLRECKDEVKSDSAQTSVKPRDFQQALNTMGEVTFQIDLSFASVMRSITNKIDLSTQLELIDQASDEIFKNIIGRNFTTCPADPEILIYQHNQEDKLCDQQKVPLANFGGNESSFLHVDSELPNQNFKEYNVNLQGTPDAYSERENQSENSEFYLQPERAQRQVDFKEVYSLCQNLILKIELVIKDRNGAQIIRRPIKKFSDVYKETQMRPNLISFVKEKVSKQIKQKKQNLDDEFNELFESQSLLSGFSQEIQDSSATVEVWLTFYTIAQYIGVLRAKDVDFLQDKTQIMVNDDLMEDLIRVCKISGVQGEFSNLDHVKLLTDAPLYSALKKRQIIKSIPYFFQQDDLDFQKVSLKVFYLEEIQRKSIYGVLRRFYALIGQNFMELVSLQRPLTSDSFILVQKYFGYLLFNQRQQLRIQLYDAKFVKRLVKNQSSFLWDTLRSELENGEIFSVGVHRNLQNVKLNLYYLTQNSIRRNFELNEEWQNCNQNYMLRTSEYTVPFWVIFTIEDSDKGMALNFTYFCPNFKVKMEHDAEYIKNRLEELVDTLRIKVKKLALLQEVFEKQSLPRELRLGEKIQLRNQSFINSTIEDALKLSVNHFENIGPVGRPSERSASPTTFKKVGKVHNSSLFSNKLNKHTAGKFNVSQNSLIKTISEMKVAKTTIEDTQCELEIFPQSTKEFQLELSQSGLTVDQLLVSISAELQQFQIESNPNLFVIKESNTVNILRLSSLTTQVTDQISKTSIEMDFMGVRPPSETQIDIFYKRIKAIIQFKNLSRIATQFMKRPNSTLNPEEFQFLKKQDEKILLFFPVPEIINDKMALLKIFNQTLKRRFLLPVSVLSYGGSFVKSSMATSRQQDQDESFLENSYIDTEINETDETEQKFAKLGEYDGHLLYNFSKIFDKDSQDGILGQIYGQALALVQISLQSSIDLELLSRRSEELTQNHLINHYEDSQRSFEVQPCSFDQKMSKVCKSYRQTNLEPIFSYISAGEKIEKLENHTHSLPILFTTQKGPDDKKYLKEQKMNSLGMDMRANYNYSEIFSWVQVNVSVCASHFKQSLFIKQLILDFNQALCDTKIELNLYSLVQVPRPQISISSSADFAIIRNLFDESLSTHSFASKRFKFEILGEAQEFNQSVSLNIIKDIHEFYFQEVNQHLGKLQICIKDRARLLWNMMTFCLLLNLNDRTSGKLIKKVLVYLDLTKPLQVEKVQQIIQKHTLRETTLLLNVKVTFTVMVGQLQMCESQKDECEVLEVVELYNLESGEEAPQFGSAHKVMEDEIRPMETGLSQIDNLKAYSSCVFSPTKLEDGKTVRYIQHRTFFMLLDFNCENLTLRTYNLKMDKVEQLRYLCQNQLSKFTIKHEKQQSDLAQLAGYYHTSQIIIPKPEISYEKETIQKTSVIDNTNLAIPLPTLKRVTRVDFGGSMASPLPQKKVRAPQVEISHAISDLHSLTSPIPAPILRSKGLKTEGGKKKKKKKKGRRMKSEIVEVQDKSSVVEFIQTEYFWKFYSDYFKEDPRLKKLNI